MKVPAHYTAREAAEYRCGAAAQKAGQPWNGRESEAWKAGWNDMDDALWEREHKQEAGNEQERSGIRA